MLALPLFTPSHFHVKIIVSAPPINRKAHQNNSEQANAIITTMASEFGGPEQPYYTTLSGLNLAVAVNILYNTREPKIGRCNLAPFVNMF